MLKFIFKKELELVEGIARKCSFYDGRERDVILKDARWLRSPTKSNRFFFSTISIIQLENQGTKLKLNQQNGKGAKISGVEN